MGGNKRRRLRSKALQFAYDRYVGGKQEQVDSFEDELLNARVARQLHDLRAEAGLTQQQLADRVDTTASVICRLEDADYDGHSLSMLRRIAGALGRRVEVRFVRSSVRAE